ncbi:unnamed protein product [Acanthosepion pharaonis]|uniref:Uncharacterized protein n=1 Tax=Acanthosepion pharaonis TaxID=158019 RepID=A0A812ASU5_ACAPH|nr:unnamed protein product [Sepia pharaonis]
MILGSDRGSTETAEDGPLEDEGRSRRSLDNRLRSAHHYEPNTNSLDLSDPSGTGDTLSVDTTNTNLSTETTSSSPLHRHLDGSSLSSRARYLGSVGSQLMIEEVHSRGCSYDQSDFDSSPSYSRRPGRLPGQPFPTGPSWWIGYPSTVRREKEREREERVRVAREKLAEERKKKIEEFKEQQRLAQQHRERQQELRRRKIDELRRREEERRAAVEERRRKQEEEQRLYHLPYLFSFSIFFYFFCLSFSMIDSIQSTLNDSVCTLGFCILLLLACFVHTFTHPSPHFKLFAVAMLHFGLLIDLYTLSLSLSLSGFLGNLVSFKMVAKGTTLPLLSRLCHQCDCSCFS